MFFSHFKASKATIIYYGERQKHRKHPGKADS